MDLEDYKTELLTNLKKARELALESIKTAQERQRCQYDRQSSTQVYHIEDQVMVFMPSEVTGIDRKLTRLYHGPFRIVDLTQQLIERPQDQMIFVVIDHLRRCYPELSDESWTGCKGRRSQRKRLPEDQSCSTNIHHTTGPVTRSMTRKMNTE